jgi:hypothetical protein
LEVGLNHVIATDKLHFKILAPALAGVPTRFNRPAVDARTHSDLIFGVQKLRGMALRECGEMSTRLTSDGRHVQKSDYDSWHVLLLNGEQELLGCARYRPVQNGTEDFSACHSALAQTQRYGPALRSAIDRFVARAKLRRKQYGEAGGWALRPEVRGSTAAINIALMTLALSENLNCGLGLTTATRNHHSAAMLCRIGANPVPGFPAYYEPKFGSVIEILHFDLPNDNPRYAAKLNKLRYESFDVPVICASEGTDKAIPTVDYGYAPLGLSTQPLLSATNVGSMHSGLSLAHLA